ncbi:unnamed protein product [Caenorhabditis sp. 36 PRJEB53466]|nr:unnamed protein product [Caenorhabditis sp. 36 PRJEB53466]
MSPPPPTPAISYPPNSEFRQIMKKTVCFLLLLVLIVAKLAAFTTIHYRFRHLPHAIILCTYLTAASLACLLPMYCMVLCVRGRVLFKWCACGAMFLEAATLFLLLGAFKIGTWAIVEVFYVSALIALLALCETLFEQKEHENELIELAEFSRIQSPYATSYQLENEEEMDDDDGDVWKIVMCRSRTL